MLEEQKPRFHKNNRFSQNTNAFSLKKVDVDLRCERDGKESVAERHGYRPQGSSAIGTTQDVHQILYLSEPEI